MTLDPMAFARKRATLSSSLPSLSLAALLAACGGGGSEPQATTTAAPVVAPAPTSPTPTTPVVTTVAAQCVATVPAVGIDSAGQQLDLSTPVVAELTSLSAPSLVVLQNLTAAGSYSIAAYDLDAGNNCVATVAATTVPAGTSETLTLKSLAAGTRHFVDLRAVTPTILQLCTQSSSVAGPCEPALETIFGSVSDANKKALAGAKVTIANNGKLIATTTDAQGNFVLKTAADSLPSAFSATVSNAGFVPMALSFTKPATGNLVSVASQQMTPVGTNYAVVEIEPTVHHLGDGNFSGSVNSGFQFPSAEGATFSRVFTVQAAALSQPAATLTFIAKGVECADQVLVNGRPAFGMSNSNASGAYSNYSVPVAPSLFVAGSNTLAIASQSCIAGDLDDFEFQNVVVQFH